MFSGESDDKIKLNTHIHTPNQSGSDLNSDYDSDLEDQTHLANEILTEIRDATYTCLVCTGELDSHSKIWSCDQCYRAFDLECIQDWAKRGSSTMDDRSWRCPSCNATHSKVPKRYTCWCGKVVNPAINEFAPHSCGQTCGFPLNSCVHGCSFSCHPGPHIKKCTALGPVMSCNCGKDVRQTPCILTPYETGWSCDSTCNDILPCGLHKCLKKCHSGLCGECEIDISTVCYCGKQELEISCNERLPKESVTKEKNWIGSFKCDQVCKDLLDCGIHRCEESCHPKSINGHKCPLSPSNLIYCFCGKTKISDILNNERKTCLDPIPACDSICGKRLSCGHKCYWKCHDGPCAPCYQSVDVDCSCQFTKFTISCGLNQEGYKPKCHIKCNAKFNCKRHSCAERCCEYRKIAHDRFRKLQKKLRKNEISSRAVDSMIIEAVHLCTKDCNKLLPCGKHYCNMVCHAGPCNPCLESSSEDLVCNCGKTIVPAPVRCGTKLPPCLNQCRRATKCGHRAEIHTCHEDDKVCPKCTTLVTKVCQCEKQNKVMNVMCYQEKISCFKTCNNIISCGVHKCVKVCHPIGECQKKCIEPCNKPRKCGHLCKQLCHVSVSCNESIPCKEIVEVSCDCGRMTKELMCYNISTSGMELSCDEDCERELRNKQLFEALGLGSDRNKDSIQNAEYAFKMKIVDDTYSPLVLSLYSQQSVWCESIETILRKLLNGLLQRDSHHFQPMKSIQRRFIHELAQSYKLFSESQDLEPKRSVFIKLESSSRTPQFSLKESLKISQKMKEIEKKKQEQNKLLQDAKKKDQASSYYNAIAIKDIFFGVTRNQLEDAVYSIWHDNPEFSNIENPSIQYVPENNFVFYSENYANKSTTMESQLRQLCKLFTKTLSAKNLAFSCYLAKIDDTASVIYEILKGLPTPEPESDPEQEFGKAGNDYVFFEKEDINDIPIEEITVSEWY